MDPTTLRTPMRVRLSPRPRWAAALVFAAALASTAATGCAVDQGDLQRWETTLTGPERLTAVVLHEKYPRHLRVQAAMSLIRMKPRKGQQIGISRLVEETLAELPPEARAAILGDMVPLIIEQLQQAPPAAQGKKVADPSFKFKDAAFLMLTYAKTQIISDTGLKKQLETALTKWAMEDFERKLAERAQAYGMEQLLRHIGPSAVVGLPAKMSKQSRSLAKVAALIAKIGGKDTKEHAGKKLVEIVSYTASEKWRDSKAPELKEANRKAGFDPTKKQFDKQLTDFQNESVVRVFGSMKKVGGKAVADYCLAVAADAKSPDKRRQTALAALEGHIDRKNKAQVDKLLEIAQDSKTPNIVVDQAFRRVKELPRAQVAEKMYGFLGSSDWEIRRAAAATLLQMSTVKHIDEFLSELGKRATKNFNLPEAITYGAYLAAMKEGDPLEKLKPRMRSGNVVARLSALSYYYARGLKKDVGDVARFERDGTAVPECEEDARCDWSCLVEGSDPKAKKESKPVKTVGDFVKFCIKPKMLKNKPPKADKKKGVGKKGGQKNESGGK
jgi:hypothetical protein